MVWLFGYTTTIKTYSVTPTMIPKLNNNGELPEGEHLASLDEIEDVYGLANDCRKKLMAGLREAAINYSNAGVTRLWIDGSFITDKKEPSDIDGC